MRPLTVSIGFLGNLYFDSRTFNLFNSLKARGFSVTFNGFDWMTPGFRTTMSHEIKIVRLVKTRFSMIYYFQFAVILFYHLIHQRADIYFASDLFALAPCFMAAKLKRARLFYDSREVYTEMPALKRMRAAKALTKIIERAFVRHADLITTTGELDSAYIEKLYRIRKTMVLRNLPPRKDKIAPVDYSTKLSIPKNGKVLLYQGIIVAGRGIETCLKIVQRHSTVCLVLLGWGEHQDHYKKMAEELKVGDRVLFAGKIPQDELLNHTAGADIGLCLIDNVSMNNYYALPNKLFEYIMCGIPAVVSDLPQMRQVVEQYGIGGVVPENDADAVIRILKSWEINPSRFNRLKKNCRLASRELNWETEFSKLDPYFRR